MSVLVRFVIIQLILRVTKAALYELLKVFTYSAKPVFVETTQVGTKEEVLFSKTEDDCGLTIFCEWASQSREKGEFSKGIQVEICISAFSFLGKYS